VTRYVLSTAAQLYEKIAGFSTSSHFLHYTAMSILLICMWASSY